MFRKLLFWKYKKQPLRCWADTGLMVCPESEEARIIKRTKTLKTEYLFTLTLSLVLFSFFCQAQYISRLGRFEVDEVKGCAPFLVNITDANRITVNECTGAKPCLMNYEGLSQQQNTFSYLYTTPGTFKLSVLYQSQVGGPDDIDITVLPNIQPEFEVYTCSGNQVSLKITDKNYDQYFINFGDGSPVVGIPSSNNQIASHNYGGSANFNINVHGKDLNAADNCSAMVKNFQSLLALPVPTLNTLTSLDASSLQIDFTAAPNLLLHLEIAVNNSTSFQLFQTLYGVSTTLVPNIKLDENYYCFRLSAFDPCTGGNTYSNIICSQQFNVTAQNNFNALDWITSSAGVINYDIIRNASPYSNTVTQTFTDGNILCKNNYCYQITANYGGGIKSISLEKCVEALSTDLPTVIDNVSAVVGDGQVELTWQQDPQFIAAEYRISRATSPALPQFIAAANSPSYTDLAYTTTANFCYSVNYKDQCDNNSPPGALACPIQLRGMLDKLNAITLEWSSYSGWASGLKNYILAKYDQQGNLLKTITLGTATTFVDNEVDPVNQIVSYKIVAVPNDPALANSVSNVARFVKGVNLFYPTAFTPNGDSLNDGFNVFGQFITKLQLNIFDRWGTLIFTTETNQSWDGTFNGKQMPETTYVWIAKLTDVAGRNDTRHGTVVLLNKKK